MPGTKTIDYSTFGMPMPGRQVNSGDYRYGFNGQEKDNEIAGAGNIMTAEYWEYDTRLGRRWNIDPVDKPWMSPYHAFSNKPITNIDPNGANDGDYYDKDGNYLGNDGIDDGKVYTVEGTSRFSLKDFGEGGKYHGNEIAYNEKNGDGFSVTYEGDVADTKLEFSGNANADNTKQADGTLKVTQVLGNGKEFTMFNLEAVGGPFGNGAPPNGDYTVNTPRDRTESGYVRDGVGFSLNVNPTFTTKRTDLRIHPDGNNKGTLGCIGLQTSGIITKKFYEAAKAAIRREGSLNLKVNITGNPNNQGGGTVPNINE